MNDVRNHPPPVKTVEAKPAKIAKFFIGNFYLSLVVALGCDLKEPDHVSASSETHTEELDEKYGDEHRVVDLEDEDHPPVITEDEEWQALRFTEERPCGEATLARLQTDIGGSLVFCAWENSVLMIESGRNGSGSPAVERFQVLKNGPLHLFRSLAGNHVEPPALLKEKDEEWQRNHPKEQTYEASKLSKHRRDFYDNSNWCDSASEWIDDRCDAPRSELDVEICGSGAYSRHQHTCSTHFSGATPCAWAIGNVVSCKGRTTYKSYWRDRTSHRFKLRESIVIPRNEWKSMIVATTDFWGDDMRLIAEDYDTSAWHRYFAGFKEK